MYKYIKRAMDFVVAFLLLIILSPLMLAAAVCIAANRDGPVLFRQERPGKNGKIFMLYKFRTMSTRLYDKNGRELSDFERMTKIGRFLRKTSVDELPQLFNILKGDMSLSAPDRCLRNILTFILPSRCAAMRSCPEFRDGLRSTGAIRSHGTKNSVTTSIMLTITALAWI